MLPTTDTSVFTAVETGWMKQAIPRRTDDSGRIIYPVTTVPRPASKDIMIPVLCDFSASVPGDVEQTHMIQGEPFRAPEILLELPWSYSADMWNAACMVSHAVPPFCKVLVCSHLRHGTLYTTRISSLRQRIFRPRRQHISRQSSTCSVLRQQASFRARLPITSPTATSSTRNSSLGARRFLIVSSLRILGRPKTSSKIPAKHQQRAVSLSGSLSP